MKKKSTLRIIKNIVYTLAILLTIVYIIYRIGFTLPINLGLTGMIFAIIVLGLEIWESIDFFIYYLNILSVDAKSPDIP